MSYTRVFGAVDEARTRDLHLGKVALYQLSYYREKRGIWVRKMVRAKRLELIRRVAPDPKSGASAIPPRPHSLRGVQRVVTHRGFEPRTP